MSFRRGPDGKPVEIESSYAKSDKKTSEQPTQGGTQPPKGSFGGTPNPSQPLEGRTQPPAVDLFNHIPNNPPSPAGSMRPDQMAVTPEPPTKPVNSPNNTPEDYPNKVPKDIPGRPPAVVEEPKTSLNFGAAGKAGSEGTAAETYVCGWLVVVDGPGKGKSLVVGPGQSAVSRSPSERITLNFGDTSITSKQQLLMIYDDENREFIVAPGNGSSLNRVNGQIVAGQTLLKSGDLLKLGSTTLRFVAFCDQSFNWE